MLSRASRVVTRDGVAPLEPRERERIRAREAALSSPIKENGPSSNPPANPLPVNQRSSLLPPDSRSPMSQQDSGSLELKVSRPDLVSPSDFPNPPAKESDDAGPSLEITLLLTTGARHPFRLDGKYLRKRSINVADYNPYAISVYTLKELIWREWRSGR